MSAGKGDTPRKVDGEKFRQHYESIFRAGKPFVDQYHPATVKLRDHSKHSKKGKK
jgi:hypothetical protein